MNIKSFLVWSLSALFIVACSSAPKNPAPSRHTAGEQAEYYPGIEREYFLSIQPTVQKAFCSAPFAGARIQRSFLMDKKFYVVWQAGEKNQTVIYNFANGTQTLQDGAATRVQVNISLRFFKKEDFRSYLIESTLDDSTKIADRSEITPAQYMHANPWERQPTASMTPLTPSATNGMAALSGWEKIPATTKTEIFEDVGSYCQ